MEEELKEQDKDNILNSIRYPEDLRKLPVEQLEEVATALRKEIIQDVAANPGHFAASLGTVELTIALHYVFNTPYDRIVWDVGHQAYGHKILTGRREAFKTNRHFKGIRPFPNPEESPYDTFACGHASNSISAALGMAVASELKKEKDRHVVAVIGDGSMSGGLAFEGLNNLSAASNDLLVILNDNNMSIDRSVGGMEQYLLNLTTTSHYNRVRFKIAQIATRIGLLNDNRKKALIRAGNSLKALFSKQQNVFEGMNIRYFGPLDGHNIPSLVRVLKDIKDMKGPKLLHLHTVKGKGFDPAEKDPTYWHATCRFDPETGKRLEEKVQENTVPYQDIFGKTLVELCRLNPRIVGITAAMAQGTGMSILMDEMPDRCFDVGIAEGHAITFAGGLAKEGMQPFCAIYSSFLQRGYDQIIHDVAFLNLPVVICMDRSGLVGQDGPTHHGQFDLSYLRPIPNLTISSPFDGQELRHLMYTAQLTGKGPFIIRYPRGKVCQENIFCPFEQVKVGKGRIMRRGEKVSVLSIGPIGQMAQKVLDQLEEEGVHAAHYDMRFLKPLDTELIQEAAASSGTLITLEDGCIKGGLGSAVAEYVEEAGLKVRVRMMGIPDVFVEHGSQNELYKVCGMDADALRSEIIKAYQS